VIAAEGFEAPPPVVAQPTVSERTAARAEVASKDVVLFMEPPGSWLVGVGRL
jgi:hypothetical protein